MEHRDKKRGLNTTTGSFKERNTWQGKLYSPEFPLTIFQHNEGGPMAEPFTIYKLTILNMLDKVDFPLTNTQISNSFWNRITPIISVSSR